MFHGCVDLVLQQFHYFLLSHLVILVTSVSGNSETRRYGYANKVHLSKVSALAA